MGARQPAWGQSGRGFTLIEVLVAVAILSISLTSLLTSQINAMRATRYAQSITAMAFLAESKLLDIEFEIKELEDGWGDNDREFEGDFGEEGWPDVRYACLVDMIELPEYSELQQAVDEQENQSGANNDNIQDAGEQSFDMLGVVWPVIQGAIERSLRKASCTVYWQDGELEREFRVETYWTDPTKLNQLPQLGGEAGEDGEDGEEQPSRGGGQPSRGGGQPAGGNGGGPGPIAPPSLQLQGGR